MKLLLQLPVLVVIAVGITLATGSVHVSGWGYGLPLPWKIDFVAECPSPFSPPPCPLIVSGFFNYLWGFFAIDVLFYMGVEYGLLLAFTKWKPQPQN